METGTIVLIVLSALVSLILIIVSLVNSIVIVGQGKVAVITKFGKYSKLFYPGLNFKIPFIEACLKKVSIQNISEELQFQAITFDQANVYFKTMLLYSVMDQEEQTIKDVAFKFIDAKSFSTALQKTIEGCVRGYVATKKQAEVLALRREITEHVKEQVDKVLAAWGYHLIDLQINDITFDSEIMNSMSKVVASSNLKAAATNEGEALLITKTKAAEADGRALVINADSEKQASKLRGQAVASFREEVAKGMSHAANEMNKANLDSSMIMFSMWMETLKHCTENGKGNVIFLDGSVDGMQNTLKQMMGMQSLSETPKKA
jgi:prepilin-type processing-associated H-X9-DG protein